MIPTDIWPATSARLHAPDTHEHAALRQAWNVAVHQHPAAVALPATTAELAAVVTEAARRGLRIAVQGGAHNPGPLGDLASTLLIRTIAMADVDIDPIRRRARVGAGALWGNVTGPAADRNLYPLHGSSPDVGVVGYSLGGGLGWVARRHGLQVNRITGAELVTADGEVVWVDHDHEPELFWGLRGGSGIGVVAHLEFELLPLTVAHAGWLAWDRADADRVLRRWIEWTEQAPETVTTAARIMQLPPVPELPPELRGRELFVIDGALLEGTAEARPLLQPLRELRPEIDTFATVPTTALGSMHGDPPQPTPVVSAHAMLGRLDDAGVDAFIEAAGADSGTSLAAAELRHLGGAVGRPTPDGGALSHLQGDYLLYAAAVALDPAMGAVGQADADDLAQTMAPWATGRPYANFTESPTDPAAFHTRETARRLQALRQAVDPSGRLHAAHALPVEVPA